MDRKEQIKKYTAEASKVWEYYQRLIGRIQLLQEQEEQDAKK